VIPLVLGTAGHIDHGKTALVRALTGVDTDRLPEERARGITIELGFAPLDLGDGLRVGVVDVPGHEALVRTMVAGATGVDLALLVVAADEGVMPQTREHAAICELLGVAAGVVALTKADLADAETVALAGGEVAELLAGSGLAGAAVVPVSSLTGAGLDELRAALRAAAEKAAARTPRAGPARLFVDRAFERRGFGAVVTGTLLGGALAVGDAVELLPGGRRARVRALQSFGRAAERVLPGTRCAVNLQGVELGELARGQQLAAAGALRESRVFDVALRWLPSAPPLEDAASVELLAGTAERRARVAPIGAELLAPGAEGFARLHLDGPPLALLPGDRFVVRGFARTDTGATLGGGRVLDAAPPRRRRSDPALAAELARLARGEARDAVLARVVRAGFAGTAPAPLAQETGLAQGALADVLDELEAGGRAARTRSGVWLGAEALAALEERLLGAVTRFHGEEPLRPGMPRAAVRGALPANQADGAFELVVARLVGAGRLDDAGESLRLPDFVPILTREQEAVAAHVRATAMAAGLEPPTFAEWRAMFACSEPELRELLAHLERDGSLTRAPGDLWFDRVAVDELRERVAAHLRAHGALETAAYKDLIGTSRKYAVPLMELFDNEHLTLRRGETRVLRRGG
jgi:selenocysteine-specific elongation factor